MFRDVVLPKRSIEDMHRLVSEVSYIMRLATEEEIECAKYYDGDVFKVFLNCARSIGVPIPSELHSTMFPVLESLSELKEHFKMPRPEKIAKHLGRKLPRTPITKWTRSYSYPSGHALISRYLAYTLSNQPSVSEAQRRALFDFANRVGLSRVQLGVHTLQDIREARRLVDALFIQPSVPYVNCESCV
ncbi:MAG: hypothetical protein CL504_06715 [Actinobacteria bacterium]|nr:hypothetical protein [Actinomycetota bacterium]